MYMLKSYDALALGLGGVGGGLLPGHSGIYSSEVVVQFLFVGRYDEGPPVLGAEREMDVVFDERLAHGGGFYDGNMVNAAYIAPGCALRWGMPPFQGWAGRLD
jgi:hypothetical protein